VAASSNSRLARLAKHLVADAIQKPRVRNVYATTRT
jgi:hypothetical protein